MRFIFQIIFITFLSVGCSSTISKKSGTFSLFDPTKSTGKSKLESKTIPFLPKEKKIINWDAVIIPLVDQLVQSKVIEMNKILLINSIKNNTNMSIPLMEITNKIIDIINNQDAFKLVSQYAIESARRDLGLSGEDSLVTRSKSIGLARYLQADYLLYSVVYEKNEESKIEMQLIEAQTGEILWSEEKSF